MSPCFKVFSRFSQSLCEHHGAHSVQEHRICLKRNGFKSRSFAKILAEEGIATSRISCYATLKVEALADSQAKEDLPW